MELMNNNISALTVDQCNLVDLLRYRASIQPDQRAYTFLVDGETEELHMTYKELDRQARAIGAWLQSLGVSGKPALLLYPPGLEFVAAFFGCLYGGAFAVPMYPPNPVRLGQTLPQLRAIVNNTQPYVALTTSPILSSVEALFADDPDFQAMRWIATDNIASDLAEEWREPVVSRNTLAYLQYTSGTTTAPRGVMLTHGNVLHNLALIQQYFEHTLESRGVIWLPPYHDMGLIGGVLQPLYAGFPVTLMSPFAFLQRPYRWLQTISRTRGTTSGGPNFAYDLCVRKITPEQRATLDLSSWDVAFNGAEPIRHDTLERFAATFEPCGFHREAFYPCYGLAEATLIVSGGLKATFPVVYTVQGAALEQTRVVAASVEDDGSRTLVSCGKTSSSQKIVVVDPESRAQCLPDQVGEIWVSGPSIAQGYWKRPEDTDHTFQAHLADTGEGPFLRTGDLGFLKDGELFITGRLKDMIIIDGLNHYPQDIEWTVERSHPSIRPRCCVAFSVDVAGEERLVIIAEVDRRYQQDTALSFDSGSRPLHVEAAVRAIRRAVAEHHNLPVYAVLLLKAGSIPKTSSGKLKRHACQAAFLAGSLDVEEE